MKKNIIKEAKINFKQTVETIADGLNASPFVSPLDACGCTGNSFC